jgi:hypothetical protein
MVATPQSPQPNGAAKPVASALPTPKNLQSLAEYIAAEPELQAETKTNILAALHALAPLQSDPWIYRMVVFFLGMIVVITVLGGMLHTGKDQISDGIIAIGSAAVGAMAGLLAPSPMNNH